VLSAHSPCPDRTRPAPPLHARTAPIRFNTLQPLVLFFFLGHSAHPQPHSFPTRRSSDLGIPAEPTLFPAEPLFRSYRLSRNCSKIGRAVQQECRDRGRMPACA